MYVLEESDCAIVPMKLTNREDKTSAEPAEGRARAKENDAQPHTHPTQGGARVSQGLGGVRQKAHASKQERFKQQLRARMHDAMPCTGSWLRAVVQGHFNYYA